MTGYGRGEAGSAGVSVVVELRSVNNRFRDLQLKVPREYTAFERPLAGLIEASVHRGRVDVHVRRSAPALGAKPVVELSLANAYLEAWRALAGSVGAKTSEPPLTWILSQPGVVELAEPEADTAGEWPVVQAAARDAIAALVAMRDKEGEALGRELAALLTEVRQLLPRIDATAADAVERARLRLEARIRDLVAGQIDGSRIAQEAALLAERADVTEEVARTKSHCDQVGEALAGSGPVGRRLEFLLQEMNREVNTIASKAAETTTVQHVVELKTVLERMREQAANVE